MVGERWECGRGGAGGSVVGERWECGGGGAGGSVVGEGLVG